tara:strand:- start:25417 stop:26058 length:642 start_codon:yes stop_codon:yes gene_type:complete
VQYFDIILFAVLAGYLGIKLYRILGTKTKIEKKKYSTNRKNIESEEKGDKNPDYQEAKEAKDSNENVENGEGLSYLKSVYKNFNEKEFLIGANKAFELIIKAKNESNKKFLISSLEDNAYRIFEKEILEREINGNSIESTMIDIINSKIVNIKVNKNIAYISVDINSKQGVLIKNSDGTLLKDTLEKFESIKDTWIFCRSLDADNPNWKLYSV